MPICQQRGTAGFNPREHLLEKGKAIHSSTAWRIPWAICTPWGRKESDTTEWLSLHFISIMLLHILILHVLTHFVYNGSHMLIYFIHQVSTFSSCRHFEGWQVTQCQENLGLPCISLELLSVGSESSASPEKQSCFNKAIWVYFLKLEFHDHISVQFSSVAQSCPTLCNPMNHSTPGLPVHHQLPEFTQTHVHRVRDAIQPSHPRSSPSPPAPDPSQHQSLFQWVNSSHEVAKVLKFQLHHHSLQRNPRADLLWVSLFLNPSPRRLLHNW